MQIFDFMHNKFKFLATYGQSLATMMINNENIHIDRETKLISHITERCGNTGTSYLMNLIKSHQDSLNNTTGVLALEWLNNTNSSINLKLFREEGWVFQQMMPNTSSKMKLF
jgi:hypothetical protein